MLVGVDQKQNSYALCFLLSERNRLWLANISREKERFTDSRLGKVGVELLTITTKHDNQVRSKKLGRYLRLSLEVYGERLSAKESLTSHHTCTDTLCKNIQERCLQAFK